MIKNYNFCSKENEHGLFFSLVDYRNNYFINSDPDKIIEFYNSFSDKSQLFDWMKERPKGNYVIKEIEGSTEIIVVIPTIDADSQYAENCKDNIFKGLHIIFVESGYDNFYFNYAHNCNAGIKKALEYNPKWIIVSNDDMYKVDKLIVLTKSLRGLDSNKFSMVFTKEAEYHSIFAQFSEPRLTRFLFLLHKRKYHIIYRIQKSLIVKKLEKKFGCQYFVSPLRGRTHFIFKSGFNFISFTDFGIFSPMLVRSYAGNLFDETFVNAQEDHDIAIRFFLEKYSYTFIDFKIGDYVGSSLGNRFDRQMRDMAGISYLNNKYKNKFSDSKYNKR